MAVFWNIVAVKFVVEKNRKERGVQFWKTKQETVCFSLSLSCCGGEGVLLFYTTYHSVLVVQFH